jgi:hypothetical protein
LTFFLCSKFSVIIPHLPARLYPQDPGVRSEREVPSEGISLQDRGMNRDSIDGNQHTAVENFPATSTPLRKFFRWTLKESRHLIKLYYYRQPICRSAVVSACSSIPPAWCICVYFRYSLLRLPSFWMGHYRRLSHRHRSCFFRI